MLKPLSLAEQAELAALMDLEERDRIRAECSGPGGLLRFVKRFWKVVEPTRKLIVGWPMEAICEHLEAVSFGHINRLLMNVPPGFMKSLLADCFFPAWEWGPMGRPELRYMCASYAAHLTLRDNRRFRRVIMSEDYQRCWGDVFGPAADAFKVELVGNDRTGWKLATSVGGTGTGERGDRVIIDDGNNPLESESEAVMETTSIWFREVIPDRLNDLTTGAIINIQQRTNEGDISGIILAEDLGYEHLMIPMEYDPSRHCVTSIGWEDPRGLDDYGDPLTEAEREANRGVLAWPERFSPDELTKLYRAKGPYAVAGQYNQMPTPRGGGLFQRDWIEEWPGLDERGNYRHDMVKDGRITFPALEYVVGWVDTAYTEKQENDMCAMAVIGIFRAEGKGRIDRQPDGSFIRVADDYGFPKAIVLYAWGKRLTIHGPPIEIPPGVTPAEWAGPRYREQRQAQWGLVEWVADTAKRYRLDYLGIETQAVGHTLEQELRRVHADELNCAIELIQARGDKVARAYAVQGSFSSHQIYFPTFEDGSYPSWLTPLADQLFVFPKGRHDDYVDALTGAVKHLRDIGIFERRESWDRAEDHAISWQANRRVQMPYDVAIAALLSSTFAGWLFGLLPLA